MLENALKIIESLPTKQLAQLVVEAAKLLEQRTPEAELRAWVAAADTAAEALERAKFGG
jgi:hypothetical protein